MDAVMQDNAPTPAARKLEKKEDMKKQLAALQVGDGGVGEDQLARGEAAGAVRGHVHP